MFLRAHWSCWGGVLWPENAAQSLFPQALTFNLPAWLISAWTILRAHLRVRGLQADSEPLENRVEGQGEEEHERAERGVSLKVHVNMVAAALQVWAPTVAVAVAVAISSFR